MTCEAAVLLTAYTAGCSVFAGCRAARVVSHLLTADIAVVILVFVNVYLFVLLISADVA